MKHGVLTGCNEDQEWMLKWWWKNYTKHNAFPVTFCDFGMSPGAKKWCQTKGNILTFDPQSIQLKNASEAQWKNQVSLSTWNRRAIWFAKAFILEQTPYEKTVWTDIDCEILGQIDPLFELAESQDGFAIAYDNKENTQEAKRLKTIDQDVLVLQAGVFSFKINSPVIPAWIKYCLQNLESEISDQSAISHLHAKNSFNLTILSNKYNWLEPEYPTTYPIIKHHTGASQKRKLLAEMEFNG